MLSDIIGVLISTDGFEVKLLNGDSFHFDFLSSEGNSIPGTNKIQLILSHLALDIGYCSSKEVVKKLTSGIIKDVGLLAHDDEESDGIERLRVVDFFIEYQNTKYQLNYRTSIHELIDLFWNSELKNNQILEETYQFSSQHYDIPQCLMKYIKLIKENQEQQVTPPRLLIELLGDALDKLEPHYFKVRRAVYYQETPPIDCCLVGAL